MKRRIGWQKYEDLLEKQLESPLFDAILGKLPEITEESYEDTDAIELQETMAVPVDESFMESVALTTNFDCWVGHTNFDLTPRIKEVLNKVNGIEVLKICSRYRFFIGVGKMFTIKNVRSSIEEELSIYQGEKIEEN